MGVRPRLKLSTEGCKFVYKRGGPKEEEEKQEKISARTASVPLPITNIDRRAFGENNGRVKTAVEQEGLFGGRCHRLQTMVVAAGHRPAEIAVV
jgi:hypothetical protein